MSVFKTVQTHWDCACVEHYIHDKSVSLTCDDCGTSHDEQPDSRETEVQEGSQLRHPLSY